MSSPANKRARRVTLTQAFGFEVKQNDSASDDEEDEVQVLENPEESSSEEEGALDLEADQLGQLTQQFDDFVPTGDDILRVDAIVNDSSRIECYDKKGRLFRRGETWRNGGRGQMLSSVYYTILEFHVAETLHVALCNVYQDLKLSFLGGKEADLLVKDINWRRNRGGIGLDKVICINAQNQYGCQESRIHIHKLQRLHSRIDPPQAAMAYETRKSATSVGFNVSFSAIRPVVGLKPRQARRKPVTLELFAGCGGFSLGLKRAGFDDKYLVEMDSHAAASLRVNFPGAQVYQEDVSDFFLKVQKDHPAYPRRSDVEHIHASPPCNGYSQANRNGGRNDLRNNKLSFKFIYAVETFLPRTASMENVTGMLNEKTNENDEMENNRHYVQRIVRRLLELNYQVRILVIRASDYGDPQNRERLFILASRWDVPLPKCPSHTHGEGLIKTVTVRDALEDLETVVPEDGSGLAMLRNGTIIGDHFQAFTDTQCEENYFLKADKPAGTLTTSNAMRHYSNDRNITVRERARLQSFPDSFEFCGSPHDRMKQIGNAVPICIAEAIARSIMESHTNDFV